MIPIFYLRYFVFPLSSTLLAIGLLAVVVGCDSAELDRLVTDVRESIHSSEPTETKATDTPTLAPPAIVIGSFNIQTFGRSKMSKPEVVRILVDVVHRFDVLAIQELRDKGETTMPEFIRLINQNGGNYRTAVTRRVGYQDRTTKRQYEEQLVYVYDANRVEIINQPYVAEDRYALMHRPPYVAHFRCRTEANVPPFTFVLMNVHVDPDDTVIEFTALQDIINQLRPGHQGEDDFILLGDMNDAANKFSQYHWFANQFATIPTHWKTNTRQDESYDNLIFDARQTSEFMNQAGVMNLMQEYQLSRDDALLVSDHLPVWAVFSTREFVSAAPVNLTQEPQIIR